jgi:hypothetical protein
MDLDSSGYRSLHFSQYQGVRERGGAMSIDVSIDKRNNLVCRTLKDEIAIDEILVSLEETAKHPDYRPGMKSLNDMREYVPRSDSINVKRVAEYLLSHIEDRQGLEAAVVVSRAVDYGMTRMLQALADTPAMRIAVFYDLDEAKQWLGMA